MPTIYFITPQGAQYEVEAAVGSSVMQAAVNNMIDGIVAECGGACTCGTCHCYIDEAWLNQLDRAGEFERDLLEIVIDPRPNSRLACQITIDDNLDGLKVYLPERQV